MASISITIPDTVDNRVNQAFAKAFNYANIIPNPAFNQSLPENPVTNPRFIDNPENRRQFAKRMIAKYIKEIVKSVEAVEAAETARQAKITQIDAEFAAVE